MSDEKNQPQLTSGGLCGCLAAVGVGLPLMLIIFIFATLPIDECDPGAYCQHGIILGMLIPAIGIVATVGLVTRFAINRRAGQGTKSS
jgi:hypothetical protein